jgi:type II secretory pathway component GspD/PulD (secretin)
VASGEERRQLVLYPVSPSQRKRFQQLLVELTAEFPTVKALTDAEPGELAIWARPAEHQVIADIIEKLKLQPPAEEAYRLVAYSIKTAEPTGVLSVLQTMFPATKLVLDAKSRRLVAWTRPAEQESIQSLIEQMDTETPAETKNQLMVYPVAGADLTTTITMLKSVAPDAVLTSDAKASTIVAWARKSDQTLINSAIERMQPTADPKRRPHIVAYPVGASDPATIYPIISALVPTARVVPNAKNGTIAVWATPEEHETIGAAVEEIAAKRADGSAAKVVVYSLKATSAASVVQALQTTVPEARMGVGANSGKLVVSARPADHETIKAALEELDQDEDDRGGVVLKTHAVTTAEPATLLATLQSLFALRREVRFSLDAKNNKIVVLATPTQHEAIEKVIAEIEGGTSPDSEATMEMHALRSADPDVVMQVLNSVVTKKFPRVLLSVDARSRQLIAVAPPEQQETIRSTIERLQAARRQLEVFQLEVLEPLTAQLAIEKLFGDGTGGKGIGTPVVDADASTQRLYVRATSEQFSQIRDLLVKMGETHLAVAADGSGRGVRVLPFTGDTKAALAEIQRVWPQLSKSPLRVLGPQESLRGLRPKLPAGQNPPHSQPAEPKQPLPPQGPQPDKATDKQAARHSPAQLIEIKTAYGEAAEENDPAAADKKAKTEVEPKVAPQAEPAPAEPPPILVTPGDDRFTIMSDDPDAIAQFEALLRALSPPTGSGGRDIIVHPLRSASSTVVAELLQKIFRRSGFDASSSVAIEADQRLNAIVVYAGRNDRAAIERLLNTLDSDEVPDSLAANRPHLIRVEHTSAARIEQVLKDIYKTQLTSGGVKQAIPVPSGSSREVAAVIQQINTANAGPLMSLGVDEATNSIVIMAPAPLVKEVTELVAELDENALHDTSRGVKIVKLKSTSAVRVKEILDTIIKDAVRRRATSGAARP